MSLFTYKSYACGAKSCKNNFHYFYYDEACRPHVVSRPHHPTHPAAFVEARSHQQQIFPWKISAMLDPAADAKKITEEKQ